MYALYFCNFYFLLSSGMCVAPPTPIRTALTSLASAEVHTSLVLRLGRCSLRRDCFDMLVKNGCPSALSVYLYVCPSACLAFYMSVFVFLPVCLSIFLSVCL